MKFYSLLAISLVMTATAVQAQENYPPVGISTPSKLELKLTAAPAFATESVFTSDPDVVDESELGIALQFLSPRINSGNGLIGSGIGLNVTGGLVLSPNRFDDDNADSALFAEASLGGSEFYLTRIADPTAGIIPKLQDKIIPSLAFRHTINYDNLIGNYRRNGQVLRVGLAFVNTLTIFCPGGAPGHNASDTLNGGPCSKDPGVSYKLSASAAKNWSSDSAREFKEFSATAELLSHPLTSARVRLYGRGEIGRFDYDNIFHLASERRRDWRYRLAGGLDLSSLASQIAKRLSLTAEVRQQWKNSNLQDEDADEFRFTISAAYNFNLIDE